MKLCVICNTPMMMKDSVMTAVYVCSAPCKATRKANMPKKLSITSVKYWTNTGMSEADAKTRISKQQRERSPRCPEHWLKKGYSVEDAMLKVREHQGNCGKQNLVKYTKEERQVRSPFSPLYWLAKGYSTAETKLILSRNSDGTSLEYHISKYGEEAGVQQHDALCAHRKIAYTLSGYINRHGETLGTQLWSKKFNHRHNSKKASEFFQELVAAVPNKYKIYAATTPNGEYGVLDKITNTYYFYDFVIPELGICVEYNGDYWHCNPAKYLPNYIHKQTGNLAKDIWENDKRKIATLKQERNINTIVVWESDNFNEKQTTIKEKIYESARSKN